MSLGAVLMTVDPPLALCWTLAVIAGWRAVQPGGRTNEWLLAGLAAGLGFLSKYSATYLIVAWAGFFLLWPPARVHLKRPGPYLAALVFAVCALPATIWNSRHGWITARHVVTNAGMDVAWKPTLRFLGDFVLVEAALLNPVFLFAAVWATLAVWKYRHTNPLALYLFCTGGLVFLGHLAYSLRSRVMPNWVAPAVTPMYCWMVIYWDGRWRKGNRAAKRWLVVGLVFGLVVVTLMHDSDLISVVVGRQLPGDADPMRRVRGYKETAARVEAARQRLLQEGKPVFIICDHYGITGLFSFYLPPARAALKNTPLVYCRSSPTPENQLYFWPEYDYAENRKGQNAIYVTEPGSVTLERDWPWKWLTGREVRFARIPPALPVPLPLQVEFRSVSDLGVQEIKLGDRVMKRVQLFECRDLR
jgi:hypothetical protein